MELSKGEVTSTVSYTVTFEIDQVVASYTCIL